LNKDAAETRTAPAAVAHTGLDIRDDLDQKVGVIFLMKRTVVGIFESDSAAERGLAVLERAGFPKEATGVVVPRDIVQERFGVDQPQAIAESASVSALGGTVVGGLGGLLVGAAMLLLPGGGAVLAAGALENALVSAAAGAGLGAAYGGFAGALIGLAVSEEQTHLLEQSAVSQLGGYPAKDVGVIEALRRGWLSVKTTLA
jgi:hypothetical protein